MTTLDELSDPIDRTTAQQLVAELLDGEVMESREHANRRRRVWDYLRRLGLATMDRRPEDPHGCWRYRPTKRLLSIAAAQAIM